MKMNIAIDGPTASGKSTIAKELCKILGYVHLNTGSMYRCVALKCKQLGIGFKDEKALQKLFDDIDIQLTNDGRTILDGKDVSDAIRADDISMGASDVSTVGLVREKLVAMQQKMAESKGFIMDGRDIGTVVLKDAEVKIYLTASAKARASRRYLDNQSRGIDCDLETLTKEIEERDYQDTHRAISPLKMADDAVLVDSSELNIEQTVKKCMEIIDSKR